MRLIHTNVAAFFAVVLFWPGASSVEASAIVNGSFEIGFNGWKTIGVTSTVTAAAGVTPTEGARQAFLSTEFDFPGPASDAEVEAFLGLAPGVLDSVFGEAHSGAAISQTFSANAGDTVSFDWNFLTSEATASPINDFSFLTVSVDGVIELLADTNALFFDSATSFEEETGYSSFSYQLLGAGAVTLGFGVFDFRDAIVDSGLMIDNVTLTPGSVATPDTLALLGLGFLGLGLSFRSMRSASALVASSSMLQR